MKSLFEFPKLEVCDIFNLDNQKYYSIINLKNLLKLTIFNGEIVDFLYIESNILKELSLYSFVDISYELEIKMFEKIFSLNNLKSIDINLVILNDEDISKIKGKNNSLTDLEISWHKKENCIINNLQNKFPNLTSLKINIPYIEEFLMDFHNESILKIIENQNCKINKFTLKNIKIFNFFVYLLKI